MLRNDAVCGIGALAAEGESMAFKPNYGRDRAERARLARERTEEKQRKKEEKSAQRKAQREAEEPGSEAPPDDSGGEPEGER
jgi:hypothetical protein